MLRLTDSHYTLRLSSEQLWLFQGFTWLSSEEQQWLSQSYDTLHAVCSFVQPASEGRHLDESQHSPAEHLLAPIALLCCNNPEPVQKHYNNQ